MHARNGVITMTYSARDEMLSIGNQLNYITTYSFDGLGRSATRQFANGDFTTYSYDFDSRQTGALYADSTLTTFGFDPVGNRTTMADSTGVTTFAFDNVNRTIGRTDPGSLVQAISYDVASQRRSLTDPDGGIRTYSYDLDSRFSTIADPTGVTTFGYDAAARPVTQLFGSGTSLVRSYDAASQIASTLWLAGAAISKLITNTYDPNGSCLTAADILGNLTTYSMDAKDRLVQDNTTGPNAHLYNYSYDVVDNILTNNESGTLTTSTYDLGSRLTTSIAGTVITTFVFEPNGNQTNVNAAGVLTTMGYDKENRISLHQQSASTATFLYAANNMKRVENIDGSVTTLIWDGSNYLGGKQ